MRWDAFVDLLEYISATVSCHRHKSGGANRENVLQLFHRATRFFVIRRSQQRSTYMVARKAPLCS